ncbi:MAG: protein-disulfide reductase DsbD [Gammaproteobacteria bacterium]
MKCNRFLLALVCLVTLQWAGAASLSERLHNLFAGTDAGITQDEILAPDEAFVMSTTVTGPRRLLVTWQIAAGYYLYHDKFSFRIAEGDAKIDTRMVQIPHGKLKEDPTFGSVEVNTGAVQVDLPLLRQALNRSSITLEVGYQGCKENSICYPPIKKQLPLMLDLFATPAAAATASPGITRGNAGTLSSQDAVTQRLEEAGLLLNIFAFFGFGLLLSLTPCVFPMIPILSGIIVGQGDRITVLQAFLLSLAYVLAMAVTYALLGVIAGSFYFNLQTASQNVWVITAFSLVFVALAFSMFGFYELQLPAAIQSRLTGLSDDRRSGTLAGAAIMGALSAIIVGPCVAPPLAGALLYISQTGNAVLGGLTLFAMGLGFGVPLLIIGASAGSLLPRAGPWMNTIKRIFGVIMLGVAIWFMGRILTGPFIMYAWALLLIISGIYMGALDRMEKGVTWTRLWKGIGLAVLVYGVVLVIGASSGSRDVFKPLQRLTQARGTVAQTDNELHFKTIKTVDDLNRELIEAVRMGKPVMLDFYADWCVVCNEMEKNTFPDPKVHAALKDVILLQADVTRNDKNDQELLQKFDLYGPPAILFFGTDGKERKSYRLIGFVAADEFTHHAREAIGS